jgi:hypothetical protein
VLQAARALAFNSLGNAGYAPQEIEHAQAIEILEKARPANDAASTLSRLVHAGVLVMVERRSSTYVAFALDPLAEFLAAEELVRRHKANSAELQAIIASVEATPGAEGFAAAIRILMD